MRKENGGKTGSTRGNKESRRRVYGKIYGTEKKEFADKLEIPPLITEDTPADFEELTVIVFESEALCHNMLQRLETNTKNMCETKEILKETSEQISNMTTSSNVTNQKENSNRRYAAKTTGTAIVPDRW
ncbi:uncharacterized protein LOC135132920 isoform X1 [Zophobas morio]|uniref:uncharacterized protein LOC135132920 isoform X1 n=1 Tax=Zophobas morio TaxID=2755281 RepID=UPI0030831769